MLFSSLTFLYYFLPAVLVLYFILPAGWRNGLLLAASLFFYAWGEPRFSIIMVSTAMTGYLAGLLTGRLKDDRKRRAAMISGVALTLVPLMLFKYGGFITDNLNLIFQDRLAPLRLVLPIGVSFYTFQILSYVVDVYRREVEVEKNPFYFLMYVSFFPQLIAGPIVRFQTIQQEIRDRRVTLDLFASGVRRFIVGLGKKVLLANMLAELGQKISQQAERTVLALWILALAFTLQIYFDFSGYSDMAIGLGRMFGFHFLENFDYPYLSRSITDFWRRWHMSLGSWFRDYVYFPLGGSRTGKWKVIRNLLIVWLMTGFWHGAAWNFIVWGLFYFVLLLIERAGFKKVLDRLPAPVSIIYTFFWVLIGFVLFNANSLTEGLSNLSGMLGLGGLNHSDSMALYYLKSYLPTLLIAGLAATPWPKRLYMSLKSRSKGLMEYAGMAGLLMLLVFTTGSLIDGSFNPFLYFRF